MAAFARNATGLVRSMGFLDQFLMSMSMVNVTGFVFSALAAPYYFPGSNLILIYVLGVIPAFAIAIMYGILSAAIPRSGGDYIWTGRILGPRFATVLAVMLLVAGNLAYLAMNLFLIVGFGLAQLFVSLGLTTSNSGYISIGSTIASAPTGYILSLIFMLIVLAVGIVGIDFYKKTLRYTFVFYIFSAVLFVLGMVTTAGTYAHGFDAAMSRYNITYSGVLAAVNANPQLSHFSLGNSLLAVVPLGFLSYAGFNYNTYLSGETKNATSTIPKGLLTAVTVALIGIAGLAAASYAAMGGSFIGGMSYLFNSGHLSGLPVQPSINFLVSLATPPWLGFLINLNITVGFFLVALSFTISYSRLIFGMAFDRVLPMKIADVSERFHSPAWALVFVTILSFIFTTVWWYTGWASS